jgi:hypothetical protein
MAKVALNPSDWRRHLATAGGCRTTTVAGHSEAWGRTSMKSEDKHEEADWAACMP